MFAGSNIVYTPANSTPSGPATTSSSSAISPDDSGQNGSTDWSSTTYTRSNPTYQVVQGTDGTFSGQFTYSSSKLAWGWSFSSEVVGTALSDVTERASLYTWPGGSQLSYSDGPHIEGAGYVFHSSVPNIVLGNGYQLQIKFSWTCEGPDGSGSCALTVNHYFHAAS